MPLKGGERDLFSEALMKSSHCNKNGTLSCKEKYFLFILWAECLAC